MNKTTKGFLLGLTTAAACVGAYYVYQNRDKIFKTEEVVNEDGTVTKKRSYVNLDNIKEKTNEAVNKTKETAQNTWKKATGKFKKNEDSVAEEIVEDVKDAFEEVSETVADTSEDVTEEIKDGFEEIKDAE
ncbi:MAG: hypothetical protein K5776_07445 [Lachnospiraceae bacterium]|nr:hypothetical protein [Lachnospiraceae bacterium]